MPWHKTTVHHKSRNPHLAQLWGLLADRIHRLEMVRGFIAMMHQCWIDGVYSSDQMTAVMSVFSRKIEEEVNFSNILVGYCEGNGERQMGIQSM
jgi:hypothetical protein